MANWMKSVLSCVLFVSFFISAPLQAESLCESQVTEKLSVRKIKKASVFYHDLGLCYFKAGFLDEGQNAWGKWLYLEPQGALTASDSRWFKEWEVAQKESQEVASLTMKEHKKQLFGGSSTLARLHIEDPMSLIHRVRVKMSQDSYVLRAAEKMEVLIPGDAQTSVIGVDRYGFELIEMTLMPIIPEVLEDNSKLVVQDQKLPWWVWAAVGGVSVAATSVTVWLWAESIDDVHLKGRVEIDDAS